MSLNVIATPLIIILTCLLITNLKKFGTTYRILTFKKVTYIGSISYSLYLYHWGILSISRWTIGITWWTIPFQLLLIFIMAISSYRFIENPFRYSSWLNNKIINIFASFALSCASILWLLFLGSELKTNLYSGKKDDLDSTRGAFIPDTNITKANCLDHRTIQQVFKNCSFINKNSKRTIWFVGDSHSHSSIQSYMSIKDDLELNAFFHARRGTLFPSLRYELKNQIRENGLISHLFQKEIENHIISNANKNDIVLIHIRYPIYFGPEELSNEEDFIFFNKENKQINRSEFYDLWLNDLTNFAQLIAKRDINIILVSPKPEYNFINRQQCYKEWFNTKIYSDCSISKNNLLNKNGFYIEHYKRIDNLIKSNKNIKFFDLLDELCPDKKCSYLSKSGNSLYQDQDHLSNYAAKEIVGESLKEFILKNNL